MKNIYEIKLINYKSFFVISYSIDDAIRELINYLTENDLFFTSERRVKNVNVIAENISNNIYIGDKHGQMGIYQNKLYR